MKLCGPAVKMWLWTTTESWVRQLGPLFHCSGTKSCFQLWASDSFGSECAMDPQPIMLNSQAEISWEQGHAQGCSKGQEDATIEGIHFCAQKGIDPGGRVH